MTSKLITLISALGLPAMVAWAAAPITIGSPDGKLVVSIGSGDDGKISKNGELTLSLLPDGAAVIVSE